MLTSEQEINAVTQLLAGDYVINIYKCYGHEIGTSFKLVLNEIPHILKKLNLNKYKSVRILNCDIADIDTSLSPENITNYSHLSSFQLPHIVIFIVNINNVYVYASNEPYDISKILEKTFVYEYSNCQDVFITKEKRHFIPNVSGGDSCFTISTYKELDEALTQYKISVAKCANCSLINKAIYDENRIFFNAGPEHFLRDSLYNFLNTRLRGDNIEIRPEQIVNTTRPVDIKVTWGNNSNHLALIEIKWLGKSIKKDPFELATSYTESRANDGAKQLVDYLEGNKVQVPNHNTVGYLVVYDLRRKKTNINTITINKENGLYYQNREIEYKPQYEILRDDFHKPIRFFIEPRCEDAS